MKLHFYGADRCVTGSSHCLEINGKKILVDCGLQQGRDEMDNRYLAFAPGSIDILLVTHAHIDHTGRIPLLVKNGFHGRILTTRVTADLMKIMLLDSAHIQESDAEYENRKGQRAGRIRHHLKHNLWRANSAVVFVGFQSPGTLGRRLLDGVEKAKLFGEEIAVKAKIVNFQGLSSHADHDHLIEWIKAFDPKPAHVFVVHGDADVAPAFADELCSLGFSAHAAKFTESYDLAAGVMLSEGYISERKRTMQASRADNLYGKLLAAGEALLELIRRFKGRSNKEITAFTGQITALIDRFQ